MMKRLSILALVATVLFSCSKKDNNKQSTPDPMDKLNAQEKELIGSWIFEKAIDSSYNGTAKDVTMECQTDDVFNFRVDKMYTKDAGAWIHAESLMATMNGESQKMALILWTVLPPLPKTDISRLMRPILPPRAAGRERVHSHTSTENCNH